MPSLTAFAALVDSSTRFAAPACESLSDDELMRTQREVAEVRRRVDAWSASLAAEIARRSSRTGRRGVGAAGRGAHARTAGAVARGLVDA